MGVDPTAEPILQLRHIEKKFGGVSALSDGNFELMNNEVHAIVGDNGAGKSTLLKVIVGAHQPDSGEYLIDGKRVHIPMPTAAAQYGIATVFQDLALIDHLDASANLFLGREIFHRGLRWLGVLDKRAMRGRAIEAIRQLKINVKSVDQLLIGMSGGQRQAVAVARAVLFGTRILAMDEPTAALGVRETGAVLGMIRDLKGHGLSVIMISHNLPDVFEVADRITVLRLGRTVRSVRCDETNLEEIVGMMTGAWSERV
jgi:ABC-type sugar transport system ATPase subunit